MDRARRNGFTLIELLVTMAVVAIMISIIPITRSFMPVLEINQGTRAFAQEIREARSMAVSNGNDVILTIDPGSGLIQIYSDGDFDGPEIADLVGSRMLTDYANAIYFHAPTNLSIEGSLRDGALDFVDDNSPISITFRPNGGAVNVGVVYLDHRKSDNSEMARAVQVLATGKIVTWRYSENASPGPWERWL
jgi:prepilin-type N-terminal cleavage/methylation domain-containing protein